MMNTYNPLNTAPIKEQAAKIPISMAPAPSGNGSVFDEGLFGDVELVGWGNPFSTKWDKPKPLMIAKPTHVNINSF
jgi:hypothetical protein